jgi:hypothetical protein
MSWMSTTVLLALRDERGGSGPPKAWEPLAKDLLREFQEQQQGRRRPSERPGDAAGGPPQQDAQRWKTVMKACRRAVRHFVIQSVSLSPTSFPPPS